MKIDSLFRNIRVLWRADSIIGQMRLQHHLTGLVLHALAALIAAFGLLLLEFAAYLALVQIWTAIAAAVALAAINFGIAAIVIVVAARRALSRDMELAMELHKSAMETLQADVASIQTSYGSLRGTFSHPLESSLAALVVPAASLLIDILRKSRESKKPE